MLCYPGHLEYTLRDVDAVFNKLIPIGFVDKNNTEMITDKNTILTRLPFTIIVTYALKNV